MPVKRTKKKTDVQSVPEALDTILEKGFTASVLQKKFKDIYDGHRAEIFDYCENNKDDFEIELSKSVKTEYGSLILKQRAKYETDTDKILKALEDGRVTPETLLSIAKFGAEDLKKIGLNDSVTELDPTEYIELRPNAAFKEEINDKFEGGSDEVEVEKPAKKKATKKKVVAKKTDPISSLEKIRAAKKKVTAKSADADLDAILEG